MLRCATLERSPRLAWQLTSTHTSWRWVLLYGLLALLIMLPGSSRSVGMSPLAVCSLSLSVVASPMHNLVRGWRVGQLSWSWAASNCMCALQQENISLPVTLALCVLQDLIAASDLYGEGYVDMDEFLAAMVANSSYSKTKDAVRMPVLLPAQSPGNYYPTVVWNCQVCCGLHT
jgi:hypothetical protein